MKKTVPSAALYLAVICLGVWGMLGQAEDAPPAEADYQLHEWGVFTATRNAAWANLDMKAEWSSMPSEFYGLLPGRGLTYRGPVRKPVIYFHAKEPVDLELKIRFTQGVPIVWWPAAEHPASGAVKAVERPDFLLFKPSLVDRPAAKLRGPAADAPRRLNVPADHWIDQLRDVEASEVFCAGSWGNLGTRWDAEKFIYYDGLMKLPDGPTATRDGERVILTVPGDQVWLDLMVIQRDGKKLRAAKNWGGWDMAGDKRPRTVPVEMADASAEDFVRLAKELVDRLAAAGLHRDEAQALVNVWKDGLFEQAGLTVFYRVPQETYDRWLPMEAKPAPKSTVRVGLVLHRHLEPELDDRVAKLVEQLASAVYAERADAQTQLIEIGGAAFPALEKASHSKDAEVASAARTIIKALDAEAALKEEFGAK